MANRLMTDAEARKYIARANRPKFYEISDELNYFHELAERYEAALLLIARNHDDVGQTFSGTMCAEIAEEALGLETSNNGEPK